MSNQCDGERADAFRRWVAVDTEHPRPGHATVGIVGLNLAPRETGCRRDGDKIDVTTRRIEGEDRSIIGKTEKEKPPGEGRRNGHQERIKRLGRRWPRQGKGIRR